MQQVINGIGNKPTVMGVDRYFKLISGSTVAYLETPEFMESVLHTTHVFGAPDGIEKPK